MVLLLELMMQMLYGSVSLFLYAVTLVAISTHPFTFGSSFSDIYKIGSAINIITYLVSFVGYRFPHSTCDTCIMNSLYRKESIDSPLSMVTTIFYYTHFSMVILQVFSLVVVSINRLAVSVCEPEHNWILRRITWTLYTIFTIVSFVIPFGLVSRPLQFEYSNDTQNYVIISDHVSRKIFATSADLIIVVAAMGWIVNMVAFVRCPTIRCINKSCYFSIVLFFLQLYISLDWMIVGGIVRDPPISMHRANSLFLYLSDCLTFFPPWFLLNFNRTIRDASWDTVQPYLQFTEMDVSVTESMLYRDAEESIPMQQMSRRPRPIVYTHVMDEGQELRESTNLALQHEDIDQPGPSRRVQRFERFDQPGTSRQAEPSEETAQSGPSKKVERFKKADQPCSSRQAEHFDKSNQPGPSKKVELSEEIGQRPSKKAKSFNKADQPVPSNQMEPSVTDQPGTSNQAEPFEETDQPGPSKKVKGLKKADKPGSLREAEPFDESNQPGPSKKVEPSEETDQPGPSKKAKRVKKDDQPGPSNQAEPSEESDQPGPSKKEEQKPEEVDPPEESKRVEVSGSSYNITCHEYTV